MPTRADVAAAARRYLGTTYRHQGSQATGMDCKGLVIAVARDLGLLPEGFEEPVHGRQPDGRMIEYFEAHMDRARPPKMGSVLILAYGSQRIERHVGILTDASGRFVHACNRRGEVVETTLGTSIGRLQHRATRAYDFRGVSD